MTPTQEQIVAAEKTVRAAMAKAEPKKILDPEIVRAVAMTLLELAPSSKERP